MSINHTKSFPQDRSSFHAQAQVEDVAENLTELGGRAPWRRWRGRVRGPRDGGGVDVGVGVCMQRELEVGLFVGPAFVPKLRVPPLHVYPVGRPIQTAVVLL